MGVSGSGGKTTSGGRAVGDGGDDDMKACGSTAGWARLGQAGIGWAGRD
jgi:hypothetical protein